MNRLIFLITLILVIAIGCEQETEQTAEKVVPVKIYKAHTDSIAKYISVTGSISAVEDVLLYSLMSERVTSISVKPGDRVKKDQRLLTQYNEMIKQTVVAAESAVATSKVQLDQLEQDYARMKQLYDQKALSPQQFDQTSTQLKSAKLGYKQAQAQLEQAKEQLENSIIRAPFGGVVASIYVENDQMVPAGQPVVQIIKPETMKAKLKISGIDIGKVYQGQLVSAEFPTVPGKKYEGKIVQVDKAVDPVSKTLQVEVQIDNPEFELKSGLFGKFNIRTDFQDSSIIIPRNAIQSRTEVNVDKSTGIQNSVKKYFLFMVEQNRAELKEVKTGISDDGRIEITSGINAGDTIIVVGQNIVKAGQLVKVID